MFEIEKCLTQIDRRRPMLWLPVVALCPVVLLPTQSSAQEARVADLEQKVIALERRVESLEKRLAEPVPVKPAAATGRGWRDKQNWRLLTRGMSKAQVTSLLGEPIEITVFSSGQFWYYPDALGGSVTFRRAKVSGWSEP